MIMAIGISMIVVGLVLEHLTDDWFMLPDGWWRTFMFRLHKNAVPLMLVIGTILCLTSALALVWRTMP